LVGNVQVLTLYLYQCLTVEAKYEPVHMLGIFW
jgi:hypothetical protein